MGRRLYLHTFMVRILLVSTLLVLIPRALFAQLYLKPQGATFDTLTRYSQGNQQDTISVIPKAIDKDNPVELQVWRGGNVPTKLILSRWVYTGGRKGSFKRIDSVSNAASHTFSVMEPGGYRVASIQGSDTLYRTVWLFADDVKLLRVIADNGCNGLHLQSEFSPDFQTIRYDKFTYYDLSQPRPREIPDLGQAYFKQLEWGKEGKGLLDLHGHSPRIADPPPSDSGVYTLKVTNVFGRVLEAKTGKLPPVAVQAKLTIDVDKSPLGGTPSWSGMGTHPKGESPLRIRLRSEGKNADSLYFTVRNDRRAVREGRADTIFHQGVAAASLLEVYPSYEIFTAGNYTAILRAKNTSSGCTDTSNVVIQVDSSLISTQAIPNVFSPNGDGVNDLFKFLEPEKNVRAVKDFTITIMNRGGQTLYRYRGDALRWPGWNGKRNNDGAECGTGVYFYVIQAKGYDGKQFNGAEYKGFVHLFR